MNFQIGSFLKRSLLAGLVFCFAVADVQAQTWNSSPGTSDWNTGSNWDLGVPNSTSATATFGSSSVTAISLSANVNLDTLLFNGSSSFNISTVGNSLTLAGSGINNASGVQQTLINNDGAVLFENTSQAVSVLLTNAAASTITFQDSSSAGSATVLNNGVLNFTNSASAGEAVISTNSGGAVSFTGNAQGDQAQFTVNSGSLFDISGEAGGVAVGSIAGAGSFNLGTNDLSIGSNGMSTTVSGIISGTGGSLTADGLGITLTLTGQNTYSGGTSILAGTLVVDNGTLGSGTVNVATDIATLDYADQAVAGTSIVNNGGFINLNDFSSAGSATIINSGGFLNFNNSSTASTSTLTNNATVTFANSSAAGTANITNTGRMSFSDGSTAGSATINNSGQLYFAGDSATTMASAGNAQITSSNLIQFGAYSTAGNSAITINGGSVQFNGNAQGGMAQFTLNGGGLNISSSTAGSVTVGSVDSEVGSSINLGANNLAAGINNLSTTISGEIYDATLAGSLTKLGTGTLTLTDSNAYLGPTSILGGILAIGNSNALGYGSVVVNTGVLMTASGPLTVDIGGNYTQASGGTFQLNLSGPTLGQWDSLDVTGSASLSGTLLITSTGGFKPFLDEAFPILFADGISGHFTSSINSLGNVRFLPFYEPNQVLLVVIQPSFAGLGSTSNQKAVGAALDNLFLDPSQQLLVADLGVQSAASLEKAYDQISPAGITPLFQMGFATEESRGALVTKRLSDLWDQADSQSQVGFAGKNQGRMFASTMSPSQEAAMGNSSSSSNQWDVFMNGLGDFGTITGDTNAPGYNFSIGGMAAGMDYRFSCDLVGGLLLGFTSSGTSQALSSVDSSGGQVGLYGGWKSGSFYVDGLVDGGVNNYTTARTSYGGPADGTTRGMQYGFLLGAGYDWKVDQMKVGPMVTGQYTYVQANVFQETGSTMTPLSFPNQGQGDLTSQLGLKASRTWDLGGFSLGPNLSVAWEHVYQGNLNHLQAGLGNSTNLFTVEGPALGTNAAVIVAGLNAQFGNGFSAQAQYQGNMGMTGYSSQGLSAGLNLGF